MPLSIWQGMEDCLALIMQRRPSSVLDAGIGFGLWGVLLRQYLDVWEGRIQPEQWTTRIDGIEIDARRVQAHARDVYTEIVVGDIREVLPRRAAEHRYDVILFGDIVEHLPKDDGFALLETAASLAEDLVVVRIPLGDGWRREGREPPDHHRSQWHTGDFARFPSLLREYDYCSNPYGLVAIDAVRWRRDRQLTLVEERLDQLQGRLERLVAQCG